MKVLIAQFVTESNEHVPNLCRLEDYHIDYGKDCIKQMRVGHIFEEADIEIIPSICANAGSTGVTSREAFDYIEQRILNDVKKNINDIDGIYLMLHGASAVERLEGVSGDHHILKMIRKIVGPYLPIAVTVDPHGNLSKEYVENATIMRTFRESPHIDTNETMELVAKLLVDLLKDRRFIRPVYRKLRLILGGEQSVSTDEPVKSINQYLNEIESDPRILSCSWHVGYLRHDTENAGCGIVVIPNSDEDYEYANQVADKLVDFVWSKRHKFHYTGRTAQPKEAIEMTLKCQEKPAFITDSGDNTTSGATGWNTFILRQFLNVDNLSKKVLLASINDEKTCTELEKHEIGESIKIHLGVDYDENSKSVELEVTIKEKGLLKSYYGFNEDSIFGNCVTISIKGKPIDIIVANHPQTFAEKHQFEAANVDWDDYDIIVVKQGYIFPDLKEKSAFSVMSLTNGATPQDTKSIPFKRIIRPIFPIDDI